MKKVYKSLLLLLTVIISSSNIFAQEEEVDKGEFSLGGDLVSSYIWRGINYSANSAAIQPGLSYSYKGLEVGSWASYSIGGEATFAEIDLYASYTTPNEMFSFTITDFYYQNTHGEDDPFAVSNNGDFFRWTKNRTGHTGELAVSFNGLEDVPFSVMIASNFYGADANAEGDFNYSSYIELGYGTSLKGIGIDLFCGASLMESAWYGTDRFEVINLGMSLSKSVELKENFELNLSSSLIMNPAYGTTYLVFAVGI